MGCKGSKDAKEDRKIDSDFQKINIPKFDEFFENASKLLENAEKVRSGLDETREKGSEIAHTHLLKDPKYHDTIQVLFWTLSADADGHIIKTGVDVGTDAPFIKLDQSKVSPDAYNLYQTFEQYVKTVTDGPSTVKDVVDKVQEMANQIPEISKNAKEEIQGSGLDFAAKAKAIATLGKNSTKLPKELVKCKNLGEILHQAGVDMKELAPKLKDLLQHADEVGAKAAAEGIKMPGAIFDKFHNGLRKDGHKTQEKKDEKMEEKKMEEKKPETTTPATAKSDETKHEKPATPAQDTHAQDAHAHDAPVQDTHAQDAHAQDTHTQDAHAQGDHTNQPDAVTN